MAIDFEYTIDPEGGLCYCRNCGDVLPVSKFNTITTPTGIYLCEICACSKAGSVVEYPEQAIQPATCGDVAQMLNVALDILDRAARKSGADVWIRPPKPAGYHDH